MSISTNLIGNTIEVVTTFNETICGEIYCYDRNSGILVLNILSSRLVKFRVSFTWMEEDRGRGRVRYSNAQDRLHQRRENHQEGKDGRYRASKCLRCLYK